MNTNLIIGLVVGAVVAVGGGYFLMTQRSASSSPNAAVIEEGSGAQAGMYRGSLTDLAARGGSWKCTVDAQADTGAGQAASSGTTYVSGDKVRADFTTTVQGYGSVDSHLIVAGGYSYSWSSMMPQGIKTQVTATAGGGAATSGQGADAHQSYAYDCQPWTADASLFAVPTDITFRTF
jgi:hypothetical protein